MAQRKPEHSLLQGDRLKRELDAQTKRAQARAYVTDKGCMNVSLTEQVLNRGMYMGAEAQELAVAMGGGMSVTRDNTLEVVRQRKAAEAAKAKEGELKNRLLKQQEELTARQRQEAAKKEDKGPLPEGWQEVPDGSSGDCYYWSISTGETSWERPTKPAAPALVAALPPSVTKEQKSDLPPGWKEVKHAATGQTYFLHEPTQTKRWTKPTAEDDLSSDITQKQKEHAAIAKREAQAAKQAAAAMANRGKSKRARGIDPLDPTGGKAGRWRDGLGGGGDRMADSTAQGSLWQQRPLPAPGSILRQQRK